MGAVLGPWAAVVISVAATLVIVAALYALARRLLRGHPTLRDALLHTHRPAQAVAVAIAVRATVPPAVGAWQRSWQRPIASVAIACLVVALVWLVGNVLLRIEDIALHRFRVDEADNLTARRVRTQISIVRRITVAVVAVVGGGAVLTTIPQARAAGASVLASAGLVGLVAALAAQSTLGNVFAGLHLAFGNSLRLDDVVVVEGEWGRIEEITLGYVVVKIWDQRRLILPSSYFTTTPFQNWTRSSADIIGTVELDVDWTVPVSQMRETGQRVVNGSDLWDRRAYGLQVTDATGGLVRARVLVSAADSSALWNLRCLVREQLIDWLQREYPHALPRRRAELNATRTAAAMHGH